MTTLVRSLLGACALTALSLPAFAETTLTIATVNNGDMIRMQKLTDDFTKANPDIKLNWVTLEENVLRQKVTTDVATKGGQFGARRAGLCRSTNSAPTMTLTTCCPPSAPA